MLDSNGIEVALKALNSLHEDSDRAIMQALACGKAIVPALKRLLFRREPSGLFQVRCRAVQALGGLGAYEVLKEYLEQESGPAADPMEQLGNEAVVNAAALALCKHPDEEAIRLLLRLGARTHLTGVIAALATFQRRETVPVFIQALEDDGSRHIAQTALKRVRPPPYQALVDVARMRLPDPLHESETSIRKRRSAGSPGHVEAMG